MTRSPLRREFESGSNFFTRLLRFLVFAGGSLFLIFAVATPLSWQQQASFGFVGLLVALVIHRVSKSYLVTLTLLLLSCFSTFRYGFWRVSTVVQYFRDSTSIRSHLDAILILLLMIAEVYAVGVMLLGYFQTLWPLRRAPAELTDDPELWREVDLLIPTYNEPLDVVRYTALAAMNIDWPADKLNVYILDDGQREEFRAFAEEAGIGYMTRSDNLDAKAGNINRALERLDAPFVAIFDADHVPTRSFLQLTMGWFERDARLGVVQTPHQFYSPDPFERNLGQFRAVPNEGEFFNGVVQDGNDFWNATFFCGSCAVLRRSALDEAGGMAAETVTEDVHTSLRMQMLGWNTAYINIPQAAGLATERLSGYVKQRVRWARGMVQVLRMDNPLFASGLSFAQRLCYLNAMMHFLYALPRLVFLLAPLAYLIFGLTIFPGYWIAILGYALPHLMLSSLTNSRIQGNHRHSFWNAIYETVAAPYILLPTLFALIYPAQGRFNVTAKGGVVKRGFFDARTALPFMLLLALNVAGLLCAIPRWLPIRQFSLRVPSGYEGWLGGWPLHLAAVAANMPARMYHGPNRGAIAMNAAWTLANIVILSVATAVARESQQRRQRTRIPLAVSAEIVLPNGAVVQSVTTDLSSSGVMVLTNTAVTEEIGAQINVSFSMLDGAAALPATVMGIDGRTLRANFDPLTLVEEEALTTVLYSRADSWLGWGASAEVDRPLRSLWRILRLSLGGAGGKRVPTGDGNDTEGKFATSILPVLLLLTLVPACLGLKPLDRPLPEAAVNARAGTTLPPAHLADVIALTASRFPWGEGAAAKVRFWVSQNFSDPRLTLTRMTLWFQSSPWTAMVIVAGVCFVMSIRVRVVVRRRARRRLLGEV